MKQVGVTTTGIKVMAGVGVLYFQEGLPLSIIFDMLIPLQMMPSWIHLYEDMQANGMTHKRIIHLLHENIFESYGPDFRDVVVDRLEKSYELC